jgi:hypothetical protein
MRQIAFDSQEDERLGRFPIDEKVGFAVSSNLNGLQIIKGL